jgi:uroporphyrinogen decarboxylase
MTGRERVVRAIEMTGPDRIPIAHTALPGAFRKYGRRLRRLYERYPSDIVTLGATGQGEFSGRARVESTDAWGSVWVPTTNDYKGLIAKPLLETWDAFHRLSPPNPVVDPPDLVAARRTIQSNAREKYLLVDGDTLWQRMFYLRGFENMCVDLLVHRDHAMALRDLILDFMLRRIRVWLELDVDGFQLRDDWGTQNSLMISPVLWRELFRPAYQQLSDLIHSAGKHFWFHSDGYIQSILIDLVEIGVDVLNPQASLLGIDQLGQDFGGKVCFLGDVDRQETLPYGTPAQVRQLVRHTIEALGSFNGGYIGRGEVASDVPLENVQAMLGAFAEFGTYP